MSHKTMEYLQNAEKNGVLLNVTEDIPKTFLVTEEYGFIVRTNAADASQEAIRREAALLRESLEAICRTAAGRTCFSCVSASVSA